MGVLINMTCGHTGAKIGSDACGLCVIRNCEGYKEYKKRKQDQQNINSIKARITKLPDIWDPNIIMNKKINEKYGKCPICGEVFDDFNVICTQKTWYGLENKNTIGLFSIKDLFTKPRHWCINCYYCKKCGCEWETPPYPTDIVDEEVLEKLSQNIFCN